MEIYRYEQRLGAGNRTDDRQSAISLKMLAIENEKAEALKATMCVRNTYRRILPELNVEEEKEKERKRLAEIRRQESEEIIVGKSVEVPMGNGGPVQTADAHLYRNINPKIKAKISIHYVTE